MSINPIWSLLISCFALSLSFFGFYFQHLRRTRKAFASMRWCERKEDKVILEGSISNQGNRSVTVSRVWLLSPFNGNTRTRYECENIHQAAPLKVPPMSSEFLYLSFPAPDYIIPPDKYPCATYDLLFYVTDDLGVEHYAQMPVISAGSHGRGIKALPNSVQLVPGTKSSH